jgi:hypothetical protein
MLRLIHEQTVIGALLIDDIDDGLPNKQVKRLGSTADPKAYKRDGYANAAKQPCYIPRSDATDPTLPGYIDLEETERVTLSAFKGKIKGFQDAGLLRVVSVVAADLVAPAITSAEFDSGATGDLTITGTGFLSVDPAVTTVVITGTITGSPKTLTEADFDTFTDTSIVILAADLAGMAEGDTVVVVADGQTSASEAIDDLATP